MWDIFICHAWEDKKTVARPLANALSRMGLRVWYDEFTLTLGDSLNRSINCGISNSRYGIVILSPDFFSKDWPRRELDGLVAREIDSRKVILPIWHNVARKDILRFSPILADRLGISTSEGFDAVIQEILKVVRPEMSHVPRSTKRRSYEAKLDSAHKKPSFMNKILRITNNVIGKPSESEMLEAKPIIMINQIFLFWLISSPFLLHCDHISINIILIPLVTLIPLAIWSISLRIVIRFFLLLHIVEFFILSLASIFCGMYQTMPLPIEILFILPAFVNIFAAIFIYRLRQMRIGRGI